MNISELFLHTALSFLATSIFPNSDLHLLNWVRSPSSLWDFLTAPQTGRDSRQKARVFVWFTCVYFPSLVDHSSALSKIYCFICFTPPNTFLVVSVGGYVWSQVLQRVMKWNFSTSILKHVYISWKVNSKRNINFDYCFLKVSILSVVIEEQTGTTSSLDNYKQLD